MASVDPSYRNLIQFVPQGSKDDSKSPEKKCHSIVTTSSESGTDIKHFYESLIKEDLNLRSRSKGMSSSSTSTAEKSVPVKFSKTRRFSKSAKCEHSAQAEDLDLTQMSASSDSPTDQTQVYQKTVIPADSGTTGAQPLNRRQRMHSKLLLCAQMGDLQQLSKLFNKEGLDINYTDFYGWTSLMCAAKEGHAKMVTYLLNLGADRTLSNSSGQTAAVLADNSGHEQLAKDILDFTPHTGTPDVDCAKKDDSVIQTFFCSVCKTDFSVNEQRLHETSLVHLFNSGRKPKTSSYLIPESNRGFQMLLKTGWEVDQGLGPRGQGVKYPVKTVLKRDRKGLGVEVDKRKAKVTHFNPNDQSAVQFDKVPERKMTARKSARYAAKTREKREKRQEQNLRLELSGGFS